MYDYTTQRPTIPPTGSRPPSVASLFWTSLLLGPLWYWGARSAARRARACGLDSDRYWRIWALGWITGTIIATAVAVLLPFAIAAFWLSSVHVPANTLAGEPVSPGYGAARTPADGYPQYPAGTQQQPNTSPAPTAIWASATCVAPTGQDSAGNQFDYDAAKAIDGRPDTAWRCDHDGIGQILTIHLGSPSTISRIGLIPGFAKTDPYDGTDRYAQSRRISAVRYTFDDGSTIDESFDVGTDSRAVQSVTFPARTTSSVSIRILTSTPGRMVNGQAPVDKIAISDVFLN